MMSAAPDTTNRTGTMPHLGFLSIVHEPSGYIGGYLVTNAWGRPVEFRLSSAVQPSRMQQVLYAATLEPYVCGELIGKALVEKTGTPVQVVFTDRETVLDLRCRVEVPVAHWACSDDQPWRCHPQFLRDGSIVSAVLGRLEPSFDVGELFTRVREAINEARKAGGNR